MTKTISKDKFIGTFQEFIEHNLVSEGDELNVSNTILLITAQIPFLPLERCIL